ncbi:MAG: asparaginase, partial [Allorhizobium sp.]
AEGVFCALLPDKGLSFAVKAEDGATRAAEAMIAALLARHFDADSEERAALMKLAHHGMTNWNGLSVGTVRTTDVLFA